MTFRDLALLVRGRSSAASAADRVVAHAVRARGLRDDTTCVCIKLGKGASSSATRSSVKQL